MKWIIIFFIDLKIIHLCFMILHTLMNQLTTTNFLIKLIFLKKHIKTTKRTTKNLKIVFYGTKKTRTKTKTIRKRKNPSNCQVSSLTHHLSPKVKKLVEDLLVRFMKKLFQKKKAALR